MKAKELLLCGLVAGCTPETQMISVYGDLTNYILSATTVEHPYDCRETLQLKFLQGARYSFDAKLEEKPILTHKLEQQRFNVDTVYVERNTCLNESVSFDVTYSGFFPQDPESGINTDKYVQDRYFWTYPDPIVGKEPLLQDKLRMISLNMYEIATGDIE